MMYQLAADELPFVEGNDSDSDVDEEHEELGRIIQKGEPALRECYNIRSPDLRSFIEVTRPMQTCRISLSALQAYHF